MMKSLKTRIYFNRKQTTAALQHCGVARHAWNWGLEQCQAALGSKTKLPTAIDLHKRLVAEVKPQNLWYYLSSKCAPQQALRNLNVAYQRCFKKISKQPKFKKRGQRDSFYLEGAIKTQGNRIKLPHFGWVRCGETLPPEVIKNVTISRVADSWFVSFKVPHSPTPTVNKKPPVGVDLGIKALATLSDGTVFPSVLPYRGHKQRLKRLQRSLSRKYRQGKPVSQNYRKQQTKVARLHQKIANIRLNALHGVTTYLSKNHAQVVLEDLNIKGMSRNHKLASAILDGGWGEFRRQMEYKGKWYGCEVIVADRYYPSSKRCSGCGQIKPMPLNQRLYECPCGVHMDRDANAAANLAAYPQLEWRRVTPHQPVEGLTSQKLVFGDSTKQEANIKV